MSPLDRPPRRPAPTRPPRVEAVRAAAEIDLAALESLLDAVPAPLEPLDVSSLDGFLCGVILQPGAAIPSARWLRYAFDADGRTLPARYDVAPASRIILQRHAELTRAIGARQWFDPWVYELDDTSSPSEMVSGWVAGFGLAVDLYPGLMQLDEESLTEPLALLFRHLDPEDLDDAEALLEEIDTLEPPRDLAEAVEDLVHATLLLADVADGPAPARRPPPRGRPGGGRTGGSGRR